MAPRSPRENIYRENLTRLGDLEKILDQVPDRVIPIDPDVQIVGLKNPVFLVIIGFATRRVYDSIKKIKKEILNVVIIEPDLRNFKEVLKTELVTDLIDDDNIDILAGIPVEEVPMNLHKIFAKTCPHTGPRASKCLNPEIIVDPFAYPNVDGKQQPVVQAIIQAVTGTSKQVFLSMGCAADSFSRWEQTIRNLDNIHNAYKIGELFDKFSGVPAIVVGGGPSVEDFITAAKEKNLPDKAVIIACDASLKRLLKEGIRPHIVTRCERKRTTIFDGITKEDTKDIYYMGYSWTPPEFFDLFEKKFMAFRDNGVNNWTGYKPGGVNGGVSAANAAFEVAVLMGCPEIYLTGVDLCFIDNRSHVAGTEVEFDIEKSKPKWFKVPGNTEAEVTTIPVWARCLKEYEQGIFKHVGKKFKVFNTSLRGARIVGTEVKKWDDIDFPGERNVLARIEQNLEKHDEGYKTRLNNRIEETLGKLKEMDSDLKKLFSFLDDMMTTAAREEVKVIHQLKSYYDPVEFFKQVEPLKQNLATVYSEPARQIDKIRAKYYRDKFFAEVILDTVQLDFFHTENRIFSLKNLVPDDHERIKLYVGCNVALFRLYEIIINRLISLLENGPQKIEYIPLKETLDVDPGIHFEVGHKTDERLEAFLKRALPHPDWLKLLDLKVERDLTQKVMGSQFFKNPQMFGKRI